MKKSVNKKSAAVKNIVFPKQSASSSPKTPDLSPDVTPAALEALIERQESSRFVALRSACHSLGWWQAQSDYEKPAMPTLPLWVKTRANVDDIHDQCFAALLRGWEAVRSRPRPGSGAEANPGAGAGIQTDPPRIR